VPRWLVVAGLVVASVAGPAVQALAASTPATPSTAKATAVTTFGIQPAGLGKVDQRGYFSYSGTPGGHLSDHAAILNYSYRPIVLRINVADAENTATGGFALTPDTQQVKDAGAWISFPTAYSTVTVPARTAAKVGEVDVPMSVVIPVGAGPGDHVGGVTVSLDSLAESPTGQKYKLVQRVGARVFIRVIGKLRPELTVENVGLAFRYSANPLAAGSATVTYTVRNTGNIALGGAQQVQVTGLFGASADAAQLAQIPLLLPGSAVQLRVMVRGVYPEFRETAKVTVTPLTIPGAAIPGAAPWTGSASTWAVPLWLLIVILLLVLLGLAELFWRRRRLRRDPDAMSGTEDEPPGAPSRDRAREVVPS
jgi:hypothetical protein